MNNLIGTYLAVPPFGGAETVKSSHPDDNVISQRDPEAFPGGTEPAGEGHILGGRTGISRRMVVEYQSRGGAEAESFTKDLVHLGVSQGISIVEGNADLSSLGLPLLLNEKVWLPDPFYSLFSRRAGEAWRLMPESGSSYFVKTSPARNTWESYFFSGRETKAILVGSHLPRITERIGSLRPLLAEGFLEFKPWEPVLFREKKNLRDAANALARHEGLRRITQSFRQDQYCFGARIGALGISFSEDFTDGKHKKGESLYWVEKRPMILLGLLNASLSRDLGGAFAPALPGDRAVYDFARSEGCGDAPLPIMEGLRFPRLSSALWEDVVALRKNAESLQVIRSIVTKASSLSEDKAIPAIRAELDAAASKLASDASVWKAVKNQAADIGIAALVPAAITGAVGKPMLASIAGISAGALRLLLSLSRAYTSTERKAAGSGAELLVKVADRL